MKFSLYKELLKEDEIMSHVFLNCVTDTMSDIDEKTKGMTEEELRNRGIDIQLIIDGKEVSVKPFFQMFFDQYSEQVKREATEMVKAQTSDRLIEIADKLREFDEVLDDWSETINWDVPNLLTK